MFQEGDLTIEQENENLKKQVEELLAKVETMSKKETDLSYKLAELSDEYKRQGARFKRETEKTKVCITLCNLQYVCKSCAKDWRIFPSFSKWKSLLYFLLYIYFFN